MRLQTDEIDFDMDVTLLESDEAEARTGQARVDELLDSLPDTFTASKRIHLLQEAARIYLAELDQPESALVVLQAALQEDFDYAPVVAAVAELADHTNSWPALLAELMDDAATCAEDAPERAAQIWLRVATWCWEPLEQYESAHDALERARALAPENVAVLELQANLYEQQEDWGEVLASWEKLVSLDIDAQRRIEILLASGALLLDKFDASEQAIECYRKAHETDATCKEALDNLDALYRSTGATASLCRILWKKAKMLSSAEDRLDLELEVAYLLEGDLDNASHAQRIYDRLEDVEAALALLKKNAAASAGKEKAVLHYRIALLLKHREVPNESLEWHLHEALSHDVGHEAASTLLIEQYAAHGEWGKSVKLYETLAEKVSDKRMAIKAMMQAARIYREHLNNPMRAAALCERARMLAPNLRPAVKMLAEMHFQEAEWTELAPLVEKLLAAAADLQPAEKARVHLMAGGCARAEGHNRQALKHYDIALRETPRDRDLLYAIGQLCFEIGDWARFVSCWGTLLREPDKFSSVAQRAHVHFQMGKAHQAMDDLGTALKHYKWALQFEPRHRGALAAEMEVHRLRGEWRAVAKAKRNRLQTATDDVKAMLLVDLGDIESEELRSPETALAAYQQALTLQPDDHRLMQRILDLAARRQQWALAYEMITRFAKLEADPQRKGSYYLAAAEICRDKSGNLKKAAEHFEQCLDAFFSTPEKIDDAMLPRCMKAFADLDAILTKERSWKQQEVAYRRMIKRLPQEHPLLASLWHSLGEIYRSRLRKHGSAVAALEVARTLAPDNVRCREELAGLYVLHGGDHLDKAVAEHQAILSRDPARRESYAALAEIYKHVGNVEAYWNVCQAQVVLKTATPEQHRYFVEHRSTFVRPPRRRVASSMWSKLHHPEHDPKISSLLYLVAPLVVRQLERTARSKGFRNKDQIDLSAPVDRRLANLPYYAKVLGLEPPRLYAPTKAPTRIQSELLTGKGEAVPTLVVGSAFLSLEDNERAFLATQELCRLRRENWLSLLHRDPEVTQSILIWAMCRARGDARPATGPLAPQLDAIAFDNPTLLEQLQLIARRIHEAGAALDARRWHQGQAETCDRVALVLCGDLTVAARSIASDQRGDAVARVTELLKFSVSPSYGELRDAMARTP